MMERPRIQEQQWAFMGMNLRCVAGSRFLLYLNLWIMTTALRHNGKGLERGAPEFGSFGVGRWIRVWRFQKTQNDGPVVR